jgi:HSP20 family protein
MTLGGVDWPATEPPPKKINTCMNYMLSRLNPLRDLEDLQNRIITAFGRTPEADGDEPFAHSEWRPAVNIAEAEDGYWIVAEMPGVRKEDVQVMVENGTLTVSGERKFDDAAKKWQRIECGYGRFSRSFTLPQYADASQVKAEFKDGLLHIHVPKSEAARPKQIEIKVD